MSVSLLSACCVAELMCWQYDAIWLDCGKGTGGQGMCAVGP